MKFICVIAFCLTLILLPAGECTLTDTRCAGLPACLLRNDYLAVTVIPFATGAIAGLTWRPDSLNLMPDFSYQKEIDDLVPDRHSIGIGGSRILLWGEKNLTCQEMQVSRRQADAAGTEIEMFNRFYQGQALNCWRTVRLDRNRTAVRLTMRLRNTGTAERQITLWDNLVAQLHSHKMDEVLMPGRPGLKKVGATGVIELPAEQIFVDGPDVFAKVNTIAPARPWIARRQPGRLLVMAVRTDAASLMPDGFFYSWKQNAYAPLLTMEMVFNPVTLPPAGEHTLTFEYLFFNGLNGLHAICGELGLWAQHHADNRMTLHLAAVSPLPARKLTLELVADNHPPIPVKLLEIPAITPDQPGAITLQLPTTDGITRHLRGTFDDGSSFTLLPEA